MTQCPACHAAVTTSEQFCEACGAGLSPTVSAAEPPPTAEPSAPTPVADDLSGTASTCQACGGEVASDGYCGTCGARAPTLRDHFTEQPAAWVAGVCDRGIRHTRNEDAVALAADSEPGSRAVLVVCDGVSSSVDSDVASLAAARAARDVLGSSRPRGLGTASSLVAAVIASLEVATDAASAAVLEVTKRADDVARAGNPTNGTPASCTFVAAVVERDLLVVGSVGDSRAYWIPDAGTAVALTVDDSFAQEQIASGVPRAEAETGPQSHAITRWLGVDAPDHTPTTATMTFTESGWLLVCSDGLWNYCSAAQDLAALVQKLSSPDVPASQAPASHMAAPDMPAPHMPAPDMPAPHMPAPDMPAPDMPASDMPAPDAPASGTSVAADPPALAGALVDWANAQGGQDNISVALARIHPERTAVPPREEA